MKKGPLVSVIVPVYNTEEFVERTLNSICAQTYKNIEIIAVNDGSTDNSEEVCLSIAKKDSRVRYVYKENGGVSSARNEGLKNAVGEYVLFCDSDDTWDDRLLEIVVGEIESENCDMVRFSYKSNSEDVLPSHPIPELAVNEKDALITCFKDRGISINMSSCCWGIYKRSIIEQNNISFMNQLRTGEDSMFVLEYTMCCKLIKFISDRLYTYYPVFEKRVNATNRKQAILYDHHELYALVLQKFYEKYHMELTDAQKKDTYAKFYDRAIGRMICFVAYSTPESKKDDKRRLKEFINQPHVIEAGKYFERVRKTDSRLVPFFMRQRWNQMLWWALKLRAEKYINAYGKKPYAYSIWREGKTRINE